MNRPQVLSLLRAYFVLTPLFGLIEVLLNVPVRVGYFISSTGGRGLYYLGCMACGAAMFRWPRASPYLGMGESSLNIAILIVGLMRPLFLFSPDALERGAWESPLTMASLVNFLLAGTVSLISFHLNSFQSDPKNRRPHS